MPLLPPSERVLHCLHTGVMLRILLLIASHALLYVYVLRDYWDPHVHVMGNVRSLLYVGVAGLRGARSVFIPRARAFE